MAEERVPPPLDEDIDLFDDEDDDEDDMFKSAIADPISEDNSTPMSLDSNPAKISDDKNNKESNNDPSTQKPTKDQTESLEEEEDLFASSSDLPVKTEAAAADSFKPTSSPKLERLDQVVEESDNFNIEITVTNPTKVGDGMNAYMVYQVNTLTNIPAFGKSQFSVKRRFSDFLGLHDKLIAKHKANGVIVPKAPEKSTMGMAKVKMSKEESSSQDFVEKRRAALERYMNRTVAHPTLRMDPDVRDYLTLDTDLPKSSATSALSTAGVLRLFGKMGDAVTKLSSSMTETDQWFEEKILQIENMEIQIKKLHESSEMLVIRRHVSAQNATLLAKALASVAGCDEHTNLSQVMAKLAQLEENLQQITEEQADSDFFTFSELLKDYIGQISAVKDVFAERIKMHKAWKEAEAMLTKKREAKVKLELANKREKIPQADKEVQEWESTVDKNEQSFNKISSALKKEMAGFDKKRCKDFKANLVNYLEKLLNNEEQLIAHWEKFLPEARSIS
ncbi:sorting nexin-2-like isoform X2 [Watersipora subatra]|uniref:sorting nexin-2-like isoform X2 n=1 Tax=Watersipora subatra TaxID=2589382 RepID=UPI00355BB924